MEPGIFVTVGVYAKSAGGLPNRSWFFLSLCLFIRQQYPVARAVARAMTRAPPPKRQMRAIVVILKGLLFGIPLEVVCPGVEGYVARIIFDVRPGMEKKFTDVRSGFGLLSPPLVTETRASTSVFSVPHAQE
jgi:hypothetical protein